ncbi:probable TLC domain-containing protein 4 [Coccomyxa sp. Obi]|nr:probable TLC domain-containing protein 4 [Coccomyxa sp. Obi]
MQCTGLTLPKNKLKRKDQVEWHSRVISSVHATVLCLGSLMCYLELQNKSREALVSGYAVCPDVFARIFLGYLLYDTTNMLAYYKYLGDKSAIIHHVIFACAAAYVLSYSIMAYPFIWLSLCEISTPSLNLRWHLAVTGHKDSSLYVANGVLLTILFFASRVVSYGAGMWHLWGLRDVWAAPGQPPFNPVLVGLFFLGYLLNLYWMQAILHGVVRALSRSKPTKTA